MENKKRVGILTMHRVQNFGSVLQTYALFHRINLLGYSCEIIDYQYPNLYHKSLGIQKSPKSFLCRLLQRGLFYLLYRNTIQKSRFNAFVKKYLIFSKYYETKDEIFNNPPKYDIYLTGSDQVWNPVCMKGDPVFFFAFADQEACKISYASSFAISKIPIQYHGVYKKYLSDYCRVSVREDSGAEIIKALTGLDSKVVCDPTLLLTKRDYELIGEGSQLQVKGEYILVYALTYAYNPYPQIDKVVQKVKRQLGLPVIYLQSNSIEHYHLGRSVTSAGPCEFISLLMNARFVVTSSFHGTAFALNFGVPFYAITPARTVSDSRIMSLLKIVGLEDRGISVEEQLPRTFNIEIDFHIPHAKLKHYRDSSLNFLRESLKEVR